MSTPAAPPKTPEVLFTEFINKYSDCNSAFKITEFTQTAFVDKYKPEKSWDEGKLNQVYQHAYLQQEQAILAWANVKDAVASPYYRNVIFNNVPQTFIAHYEKLPSYEKLFGNLAYEQCEQCDSLYGASAYLVDVLRFIDTHIKPLPTKTALKKRRPDLYELPLNCKNTTELVPYIELVNEVLEATIRGDQDKDVYQELATMAFPFQLPFHLYLEQIRAYLGQLKTSLYDIYKTFGTPENACSREILGLYPKDVERLISPNATQVAPNYGITTNQSQLVTTLTDVNTFLEKTGLSRTQLDTLLYLDLSDEEINNGLTRLFFINNNESPLTIKDTGAGVSKTEKFVNLTETKLDKIHRFVRLVQKLEWDFADVDWALRSLGDKFVPENVLKFNGTDTYLEYSPSPNLSLANTFTIDAWIKVEKTGTQSILSGSSFDFGINDKNCISISDGTNTSTSFHPIETNVFTHVAVVVTAGNVSFIINGLPESDDASSIPTFGSITSLKIGGNSSNNYFKGVIRELRVWNAASTSQEIADNRYQRLTTSGNLKINLPLVKMAEGWTCPTVDQLIWGRSELVIGSSLPTGVVLNQANLNKLAKIKFLKDKYKLSVAKICALWYEPKSSGKAKGTALYDQIFNSIGQESDYWDFYMEIPRVWHLNNPNDPEIARAIQGRLMGALRLSQKDLLRLVKKLNGTTDTLPESVVLNHEYLTRLYQLTGTASLFGIKVEELLLLFDVTGKSVGLDTLFEFSEEEGITTEWLKKANLNAYELHYLIKSKRNDQVKASYSEKDIRNMVAELKGMSIPVVPNDQQQQVMYKCLADILKTSVARLEIIVPTIVVNTFFNLVRQVTPEQIPSGLTTQLDSLQTNLRTTYDTGTAKTVFQKLKDKDISSLSEEQKNVLMRKSLAEMLKTEVRYLPNKEAEELPKTGEFFQKNINNTVDQNSAFNSNSYLDTALRGLLPNLYAYEGQDIRQCIATPELSSLQTQLQTQLQMKSNAIQTAVANLLGTTPEWLQGIEKSSKKVMDSERFFKLIDPVNNGSLPEGLTEELDCLSKTLFVSDKFALNTETMTAFLDDSLSLHIDINSLNMNHLKELQSFREFQETWQDTNKLLDIFKKNQTWSDTNRQIVAEELANWDIEQLKKLAPDSDTINIGGLAQIKKKFDLSDKLRIEPDFMAQLARTSTTTIDFYQKQATALLNVLQAKYTEEQWQKVYKPIKDKLSVKQRDALTAYVMYHKIPASYGRKDNPDILTDWLLIDVQMGSETDTSRIKQAILSVQYYLQRCLMKLEPEVEPQTIPEKQWKWMKNYRVWEANRKVFLYPENYLEPELRKTKTQLFEELENEIKQDDINDRSVVGIFTRYLNRLTDIADLKIVGSYVHEHDIGKGASKTTEKHLYLIGRTRTAPYLYYYRTYVDQTEWKPWQKIELSIKADYVTPVFAFGRLFIFWSELTEKMENRDRYLKPGEILNEREEANVISGIVTDKKHEIVKTENVTIYTPEIKYSYIDFSGAWKQPQTFKKVEEISEAQYQEPIWQRVYTQRLSEIKKETEQTGSSGKKKVNVWKIDRPRNFYLPRFDMNELTLSFWVKVKGINNSNGSTGTFSLLRYPDNEADGINLLLSHESTETAGYISAGENVEAARTGLETAKGTFQAAIAEAKRHIDLGIPFLQPVIESLEQVTKKIAECQKCTDVSGTINTLSLVLGNTRALRVSLDNALSSLSNIEPANQVAMLQALPEVNNIKVQLALINTVYIRVEITTINSWLDILRTHVNDVKNVNIQTRIDEVNAARKRLNTAVHTLESTNRYQSKKLSLKLDNASVDLTLNEWQYCAMALSISEKKLYCYDTNGSNKRENPITGAITLSSAKQLTVGGTTDNSGLKVWITELRVWGEYRKDEATIKTDFDTRLKDDEPQLKLYVKLDEGDTDDTLQLKQKVVSITEAEKIERILLFYGNNLYAFRNNQQDKSVNLHFPKSTASTKYYDLDLYARGLYLSQRSKNDLSIYDFAGKRLTEKQKALLNQLMPTISYYVKSPLFRNFVEALIEHIKATYQEFSEEDKQLLVDFINSNFPEYMKSLQKQDVVSGTAVLTTLRKKQALLMDVSNQPGWYILDTGEDQFLFIMGDGNYNTIAKSVEFKYLSANQEEDAQPINLSVNYDDKLKNKPTKLTFKRLNTSAVHELKLDLFEKDVGGLLSLDSQGTPEFTFSKYGLGTSLNGISVTPPSDTINFDGSYGLYYWELFFHAPFMIANQLNANQRFEEAQKWYHYIFNPTTNDKETSKKRYWRFKPFSEASIEKILSTLLNKESALRKYHEDPFDAHAIADLRINAYQKAVVMKYIDNLLDWGDHLFKQDTREGINEASMLYILAYNILGRRPQMKKSQQPHVAGSYSSIKRELNNTVHVPEFLQGKEGAQAHKISDSTTLETNVYNPNIHLIFSFCVIENDKFIQYWDRVEDRLNKIRHSLNFEGIFRKLALFEPPIDPMQLVQAAARGAGVGSGMGDISVEVPYYRYTYMLEKARYMISNVISLGNTLLSVLEKKDGEELSVMRTTHEKNLLTLMEEVKQAQLDEAQQNVDSLKVSLESVTHRQEHYNTLINDGISSEEEAQIALIAVGQGLKGGAIVANAIAAATRPIPEMTLGGAGFGASPTATATIGGSAISKTAEVVGKGCELGADLSSTIGQIMGIKAGYDRRKSDWELQEKIAGYEVRQLEKQIQATELRLNMARQELKIHQKTQAQNQEIEDFFKRKFTNQELYNWMLRRIAGLYFEAYKIAHDMAKMAEKALQYELPTTETFIRFGHWDSLRKGLLAGESLMLDLNRMEKAAIEKNKRNLEIEKDISLRQIDPAKLISLKNEGKCEFDLTEQLFDQDYPGHYCRQIKTIALSIPAVVGPYQTIKATLMQNNNKLLLKADKDAVEFLLNKDGSVEPENTTLRVDWPRLQEIAISRGVNDSGLFMLNFQDERYLPFEGTGAVSRWKLEMPQENNQFDFNTITDVIIHLRYTAKSDGTLKEAVKDLVPLPAPINVTQRVENKGGDAILTATWSPVHGATNYQVKVVKIAEDCLTKEDVDCKEMISQDDATQLTFDFDLTDDKFASGGQYLVLVKAQDGSRPESAFAWATTITEQLAAPTKVEVTLNADKNGLTVNWDSVGVHRYEVQLLDDSDNSIGSPVIVKGNTTTLTIQQTGTYKVKVRMVSVEPNVIPSVWCIYEETAVEVIVPDIEEVEPEGLPLPENGSSDEEEDEPPETPEQMAQRLKDKGKTAEVVAQELKTAFPELTAKEMITALANKDFKLDNVANIELYSEEEIYQAMSSVSNDAFV